MTRQRLETATAVAVPQQRQQTVLWIIAILLAIIATAMVVRTDGPLAIQPAFGDVSLAGARGIYAFTGQLDQDRYGLFMMDVDSSNIWVYEYLPATRKLKLVAARSFRNDRYLEDYCNAEPSPKQVQTMLREQSRIKARIGGESDITEDDGGLATSVPGVPHTEGDGN